MMFYRHKNRVKPKKNRKHGNSENFLILAAACYSAVYTETDFILYYLSL